MAIDPVIQSLLDVLPVDVERSTLDHLEMRARLEASVSPASIELPRVEDRFVDSPGGPLPVRIYSPEEGADDVRPGMIWLHGGGFVIGSIATDDAMCRELARDAGIVVVSVEYRLAPEHPFPAAIDDAMTATHWVAANAAELGIDPRRVAIGGGSAGGNLAAVTALRARDEGGPPLAYQLLVNPSCDHDPDRYPSMVENATGYMLTATVMGWFSDQYLPPGVDRHDHRVSPMQAASLAGLPAAQIVTAEFDPLRDEGEAYASRLAADGVAVTYRPCPGGIHGFLGYRVQVASARAAFDAMVVDLREALGA
jgi:acetyl esterase